jgi:HPr kinase/phosphorylase
MHGHRRMHGSSVSRNEDAILILGPPASGKSDLVLRLLARGFELVADDQVDVDDGIASCPPALAGMLEVRGLGIIRLPYRARARLALIVELARPAERLPMPRHHPDLGMPVVVIDPTAASAPERAALALDCATGRVSQVAGAFAP